MSREVRVGREGRIREVMKGEGKELKSPLKEREWRVKW